MNRRNFKKLLASGILGVATQASSWEQNKPIQKPRTLKIGDHIGLITPGSAIPQHRIEDAIKTTKSLGLVPVLGKHIGKELGYLAGSDEERLEDLHHMFEDDKIQGIWCIRGGYGCTRLLPHIRYDLIRANPKVFIGYSDITALHHAFLVKCQLATFHGPLAVSEPTTYSIDHLKRAVMGSDPYTVGQSIENLEEGNKDQAFAPFVINSGSMKGPLVGGNLSLMTALVGTPWQVSYADKLVFIEDIDEKPYSIDRMLVQLLQATDLSQAAGILLGVFYDCNPDEGDRSLTLRETLVGQLAALDIPVFYGFSFGHIDHHCTLPVGTLAEFDQVKQEIRFLESGTES